MKRRLWALVLAALLTLGILAGCAAPAPDSRSVQEDALQLIEDSTQETAMPTQIAEVELSAEPTQEEPAAEPAAASNLVGVATVLAEGDAAKREDIIYLDPLPLFFKN